jgi:hypothetical protein
MTFLGGAEWLLAHVPGVERRELPRGGHLLDDKDLDSLYAWLIAERGTARPTF